MRVSEKHAFRDWKFKNKYSENSCQDAENYSNQVLVFDHHLDKKFSLSHPQIAALAHYFPLSLRQISGSS
jgi:hypothetical protein